MAVPLRELGNTGMKIMPIVMGCWQFGDGTGTYPKMSDAIEDEIVRTALDVGINAFDTAEAYASGVSEQALGRALQRSGRARNEYYIFTKINPENLVSYDKIIAAVDRSLKNLNTSYVDLYQIHWANHDVPIAEVFQNLEKVKATGKIRAIGVSNFGQLDQTELINAGFRFETNQLPYSLVTRAIEFGIQDIAVKNKASILAYSPLAQGLLTGKYTSGDQIREGISRSRFFHHSRSTKARHKENGCEKELFESLAKIAEISKRVGHSMTEVALAWALAQKGVAGLVCGFSSPEQVVENVKGAFCHLPAEVIRELTDSTEPVKAGLGGNPDLWALDSRYR